jgi:hypothetical protein
MMKFVLISSITVLTACYATGQAVPGNLQKQLDELRNRVKVLEKENAFLKAEDKSKDSILYASMRSHIFGAFNDLSQLYFDFKNTSDKVAVTGLFTKLIQASNPTSDILGFRFSEIIFSAAEKNFLDGLKDNRDKKRFSQIISKIVNNPVVSSLANTNPITSVVTAIISTIAGFTTSRLELEKDGGRIKDVSLDQQDAFDNRSITAFRKELQVYIDFYDAMIFVSSEFLAGLNELNIRYDCLMVAVSGYKTQLYSELGVQDNNLLIGLSELLPDPASTSLDYASLMRDPAIRKCYELTVKFPALFNEVSDYKKEFNLLLFNFLTNYSKILEMTRDFPEKDIDKSKSEALIIEIDKYLRSKDQQN